MTSTKRTMMSVSPKSFGREHRGHARRLEPHGVRLGDDAADDHRHVARAGRAQPSSTSGTSAMCEPDRIDRPTQCTSSATAAADDLLGRQPDALVDHLEAGVAGAYGDLLGAVGVPVEAGLADQQPQPLAELRAGARPPRPHLGERLGAGADADRAADPGRARGTRRTPRAARRPTRRW